MSQSSQYDGQRFHNPGWLTPVESEPALDDTPAAPRSGSRLVSLLRWRMAGNRSQWPERIVDPPPAGDPWLEPGPGQLSVTFIGHSSFLVRLAGLTLLTDPVFSERASPVSWAGPMRARAPGRALADLPPVDLILLSHNHYDHLDLPTLRSLRRLAASKAAPLVVTPLGNARHVRNAGRFEVRELDWWQQATLELPGAPRVTATPARHFSSRTLRDAGRSLWSGFMLEAGGIRLLFAGDSGDGLHWQAIHDRLGPPDLALLPIGAYAPRSIMRRVHIDPAEAVQAHRALGAAQSVGMHFGTFQLTDEAIDAPERALAEEKLRQGVADDAFITLGFGECRRFELPTQR